MHPLRPSLQPQPALPLPSPPVCIEVPPAPRAAACPKDTQAAVLPGQGRAPGSFCSAAGFLSRVKVFYCFETRMLNMNVSRMKYVSFYHFFISFSLP